MMFSNNKPTISIIVPVYQVEAYLSDCVESILRQTFTDWELLFVDDGSTDKGGLICDDYASSDPRIRVFHQENKGLSAARNKGLDYVRGKYITMLDSDDVFMFFEYLELHVKALEEADAQMTICGFSSKNEDLQTQAIDRAVQPLMLISGAELTSMTRLPASCFYGHVGAKLYKKELFDKIRFPVGRYIEDNAIAHRLIFPCERIVVLDTPMYGYRVRSTGILGSTDKNVLRRDVIFAFQDRIDYLKEMGRPDLALTAEQLMIMHLNHYK